MADPVAKSWSRIEAWLVKNVPAMVENLRPGATDEEINALESTLGVELPEDLSESLRLHNGGVETGIFPTSDATGHSLTGFSPLSVGQIESQWTAWNKLLDEDAFGDKPTKPAFGICDDWWNRAWIPFAGDGGGDLQCIDLAPSEFGMVGQIIGAWRDDAERHLISASLGDYLQTIAEGLEDGHLEYERGDGIIPNLDEL